ncbi:carboxymethylenebutenolidase [Humibacillus sp. DSM 29435]|uniref:dienelactone hydrolase family protein n=1 Tax=Humibacillus sp. DSM 29435 TaxID=1869167 RepID=UPI000873339E|nr:dienelactone hydrolase family protein [Humibacillus sp. DSM 29435]OFE16203.1 carboxymethylenebutenolidase [Humibacillus sp. DSM 29435]
MAQTTNVTTEAGAMPALLWLPPSGSGPGIVLLQEIFGVTGYIQRRAAHLADLGYVVLAPQIYWRLGVTEPVEGADALELGMGLVQRLDWDAAVADAVASVDWLRGNGEVIGGVGVVGFCFGGGLGFMTAAALERRDPATPAAALVSYYGSSLPELGDSMQVAAPSLHHFGLADSYIDSDTVRAIEASVTRQPATTFYTYEGADHAFDNDEMPLHHPAASSLAWERTSDFLAQHLPTTSP